MKATMSMEKNKDMENSHGKMDHSIKENFTIIILRVKVNIYGPIKDNTTENGKIIK